MGGGQPRGGYGGGRGAGGRPGGGGGGPPPEPTKVPSEEVLRKIIVDGNVDDLIRTADALGRGLARTEELTTSQIRTFFGAVRQMQSDVGPKDAVLSEATYRNLRLLKPKLAYQARREQEKRRGLKGQGVTRLKDVLTPAIDLVEHDAERFRRFVDFFEAILAYHKAAGGKES